MASINTEVDCEPELPAESFIDDAIDNADEKANVTIVPPTAETPGDAQNPVVAHIIWNNMIITCVTNPRNNNVRIQKILELNISHEVS